MQAWITFWEWTCFLTFAGFYLTVLFIIPFGARDLILLFRHLKKGSQRTEE